MILHRMDIYYDSCSVTCIINISTFIALIRAKLSARKGGVFDVPFIIDPNTGIELFKASDIIKYLEATYTI